MAAGRRLSDLLLLQQEPFLFEAAKTRRLRRGRGGGGGGGGGGGAGAGGGGGGSCCPVAACRRLLRLCNHGFKKRRGAAGAGGGGIGGLSSALSKVLCSKAMRKVLHWENLGGGWCFAGVAGGGDREFRRLRRSAGDSGECDPRAMEFDDDDGYDRARWKTDMEVDSSRQHSPVSVLDLHSDDESPSPVHSRWEDDKPSTSGSSLPSEDLHDPTSPCFTYNVHDKACAMEVEDEDEEMVRNRGKSIEEQISAWERIAGDISKIPRMVEQDLSQYMQQWRQLKPEVREIGARIETLIFEEMRRETVCDMLASHCTLAPTSC